ncbi:hypothetical protein [Streptomyces sp. NBC_01481]|uniref:hypothetical protein n=1 Tax=Streptomyces sp. NBC_01481 TaxID=2975869 RepID=UPI002259168E|nr:hypothetical protein [Streptomyces sp. NBC_01481]MCX4584373.1 hypothetical protein [Streptomyces sp. NBC_01481]
MHQQDAIEDPSAHHHISTGERGSFALARCTCGWTGPARRSRERARTDASLHAEFQTSPAGTEQ